MGADKDTVTYGPAFDDEQEITPEFEERVYTYFDLERPTTTEARRAYGAYYSSASTSEGGVEAAPGERTGVMTDKDQLRVQRTEEELRAGTREREAGAINVRKRIRTDQETMEVPTRREEVSVDRVPVEGETSGTEIGDDDEVRIPVTEEEVVVEKRPVAKEEVRIRKDVVEDTEVVEEDVRREEIEIDDETTRRTS